MKNMKTMSSHECNNLKITEKILFNRIKKWNWLLLIIIAVILNLVCFTGVSAYFTSADNARNTFTVGNSEINIVEDFVPDELEPGVSIVKKVCIENTGKCPCAVRVMVNFTDSDMEKFVDLDINDEAWELGNDGYYYYKSIIDTGGISEFLFTQLTISDDAAEEDMKDFDIYVYAESINAELTDEYTSIEWKK